ESSTSMSYYPIFLQLERRTVLVVGGGSVALRKVETLLEYGALVRLVSRELTRPFMALMEKDRVAYLGPRFREEYLDGIFLVIAATDDHDLNHTISESARSRGLLVNAVDQPEDCTFIVPSIVRRGDLLIAVSTSGKSPAFARRVREGLEQRFGDEYGIFLALMGKVRERVLALGLSQAENSRLFKEIVDADLPKAISAQQWEAVEAALRRILPQAVDIKDLFER
ncbi:MAG: bifunctional precorrin-2 dehydrogenase/sirohydrochlorin ferrochelatase, partial [Deltaproteobacteria bacterium]|nr:bifunctional precorrin-2 dehydrogenase/sirohydrochlorin ferrochelatase [Deltaproteobacteria bacterium]